MKKALFTMFIFAIAFVSLSLSKASAQIWYGNNGYYNSYNNCSYDCNYNNGYNLWGTNNWTTWGGNNFGCNSGCNSGYTYSRSIPCPNNPSIYYDPTVSYYIDHCRSYNYYQQPVYTYQYPFMYQPYGYGWNSGFNLNLGFNFYKSTNNIDYSDYNS